jgi:hypothetical protein
MMTFCRKPDRAEVSAMLAFLSQEAKGRRAETGQTRAPITEAEARHQALVQLCRGLFNTNEFVYAD